MEPKKTNKQQSAPAKPQRLSKLGEWLRDPNREKGQILDMRAVLK